MSDLNIINKFDAMCQELNSIKGTNDKIAKLQTYKDLKDLIKVIWEPNTTTGITKKGLLDFKKKKNFVKDTTLDLLSLLQSLIKRELTGDDARATIWGFIAKYPTKEETLLGIFEKNPRIRMSEVLIEKAFPGMFTIFKVALAMEYTEEVFQTGLKKYKKAFLSRKLDGMRLITIVHQKTITFYSRVGNVVTSLDVLKKDIQGLVNDQLHDEELEEGVVFDGEIVSLDGDKEDFKRTISEVRQIDKQMKDPHYFIFDVLTLGEFQGSKESSLLEDRLKKLVDILSGTKYCHLLEQIEWSPDNQTKLIEKAKKQGWEGIMVRMNTIYEAKRTKNLLKYKFIQDGEYSVKKVIIVDMPFPNASGGETIKKAVKSVIIEHKNCEVNVGSGFSADERLKYAKNPELLEGKTILVNYQEEFMDKNGYSLRCPIFKALLVTRNF